MIVPYFMMQTRYIRIEGQKAKLKVSGLHHEVGQEGEKNTCAYFMMQTRYLEIANGIKKGNICIMK